MNGRVLIALLLLLPFPLVAQTTVRGIVTEQNSGNRPIPGVQIKALGSAPEVSDNAGAFQLTFAAKKPGERIIVTELAKKGYEIVNKDVVSNWLIPADPQARTKIVMCPEGTLTRNILRYYDISLAGLTRGYNEQLRRLQAQRDSARIGARAFGEQATVLAEQFANQQKHLEELAERFARENFDDCSEVHRQAFEAFSRGRIQDAIGILEAVNSEEEIAKAKTQKEQSARMGTDADRMAAEARSMQAESDSIIRLNIDKLMFQGDLYVSCNRFDDAEMAYETAVLADTSSFAHVSSYARYLARQQRYDKALRWGNAALASAGTEYERATAIADMAQLQSDRYNYERAERGYEEALAIFRGLAATDPETCLPAVATSLDHLAVIQTTMREFEKAETNANEALAIVRALVEKEPDTYLGDLATSLTTLARLQHTMHHDAQAEALYGEALTIRRTRYASGAPDSKVELTTVLDNLATVQFSREAYQQAEANLTESLAIARELAETNPDAYAESYATTLNNLAVVQRELNRYDSAEANQIRAIAIYEDLVRKNPQFYNPRLALSYANLAVFYDDRHHYERAVRLCAASVAMYRKLAAADPHTFTPYIIENCYALGTMYRHNGASDSAEASFAEALERVRAAAAVDSNYYHPVLADLLISIAWRTYPAQLARAMAYTREAIGIYQRMPDKDDDVTRYLSLGCGRMAHYLLLAKQFPEAESYARMEISYAESDHHALKNLAHSLLFQGRYEEARSMYVQLKDEAWDGRRSFKDVFLADFDEFEHAGVTHPDIATIRGVLNAE